MAKPKRRQFQPKALRAEMKRLGLRTEDLSNKTGLGTSTITKILSPKGNPTVKTLCAIAEALDVDPGVFFATGKHYSADGSAAA